MSELGLNKLWCHTIQPGWVFQEQTPEQRLISQNQLGSVEECVCVCSVGVREAELVVRVPPQRETGNRLLRIRASDPGI